MTAAPPRAIPICMGRQLALGVVAGAVVGAALLAGLWLYDGTAAFASARVTGLRMACGACFVALGAWLLVRHRAA